MKYVDLNRNISLVFSIVFLLIANTVLGQNVAVLPPDPAVRSGVLPNGMRWYVATDPSMTGSADFALVQMTGGETIQSVRRDRIVGIAQEALMSQPLLKASTVQDYFIGKGCVPGSEGFAEVTSDATVFRFRDINLKQSGSVLDSTLLVLMNIAGRCYRSDDMVLKKWYAPSDQAIVVAGDVNADAVSEKLRMLSYMIPESESVQRKGYVWKNEDGVRAETSVGEADGVVRVSAVWRLERTPRELMHTVQPAIYAKYMIMTGLVARDRILKHFKKAGLPVASVTSSYTGGSGTFGDGAFSMEIAVSEDDLVEAVTALAGVLSSIDHHGVQPVEAGKAALEFVDMVTSETRHDDVESHEYVNRCVSSFIYNTSLSSRNDVRKFYLSKELSDETESCLLASVASPSLDGNSNLTLICSSDSLKVSADSLTALFKSVWQKASLTEPEKTAYVNVPHLPAPETKVKIKSTKKEYLSGGSVWTLANGMKVIYRNMPTEGSQVHYSLSLNGGSGSVEGLGPDDGGYLSDYFNHCRVAGVSGAEFRNAIRRKGMRMSCEVGHSSTLIRGSVPVNEIDYMIRSLAALMNSRQPDKEAWDYYLKGEPLRQAVRCTPGSGICLSDDFARKAESFFGKLSENVNNGVLVIIGNVDEKRLKSIITAQAGAFRTTDRTFKRTETFCRNFHGTEGYHRGGTERTVNVCLTAPMALTAENYYTAALASMVLKRHFALDLAGKGMRVNVSHECRRFPQESMAVNIIVSEADKEGFASGTVNCNFDDALLTMKDTFADMSVIKIDDNILASYKGHLEKRLASDKADPEYWIDAINLRYLDGKDFTTGAEAKIKAVTGSKIIALLSSLETNSKIEYVITGK